jgi:hypothetical protein
MRPQFKEMKGIIKSHKHGKHFNNLQPQNLTNYSIDLNQTLEVPEMPKRRL